VVRGEDQDHPSRGGAEDGADETRGDGAEWLLRQLGAGGPGGEDVPPGAPSATRPGRDAPALRQPGRSPEPAPASREPGPPKDPGTAIGQGTPEGTGRAGSAGPTAGADSPAEGDQRRKILLLLIALAAAAVLALASLFFLGMRLGAGSTAVATPAPAVSATPSETPSHTPTPTEEPAPAVAGPVAPGTHPWDELRGGECLDPYASPWEEEYTVVDCAAPHPAQLVYRGEFPTDAAGYPGEQAIQPQLSLLCSASTVIDVAAAASFSDLQVQGAYPATAEQWEAGQRDIFCFVSRSTGEPLTGSIAVPQAAPVE
jgi:Septum formation